MACGETAAQGASPRLYPHQRRAVNSSDRVARRQPKTCWASRPCQPSCQTVPRVSYGISKCDRLRMARALLYWLSWRHPTSTRPARPSSFKVVSAWCQISAKRSAIGSSEVDGCAGRSAVRTSRTLKVAVHSQLHLPDPEIQVMTHRRRIL